MKKLIAAVALMMFLGCVTTTSDDLAKTTLDDEFASYKQEAERLVAIVSEASTREKNLKTVKLSAKRLIKLSTPIVERFINKYQECQTYLQAAQGMTTKLDQMTVDKMESDYHRGAGLPEGSDVCYHAKDLVVHPATVVVLAEEVQDPKDFDKMKEEITEVLAHLEVTKRFL